MKVYIVTSGCYSDYSINGVFIDKQKAEEYAEWLEDSNEVEEYETCDDNEYQKQYGFYVRVEYDLDSKKTSLTHSRCYKTTNEFKCDNYNIFSDKREYYDNLLAMSLRRYVPANNIDIEFHQRKYEKAAYDLMAIARQKLNEGYTVKQINELLKGV